MILTYFCTPPYLNYRPQTPPLVWPLTPDCPDNFENGKFMLPLGQLVQEELWEIRRFHLWYMHAAKLGMKEFVVKAPKEYFHLEDDCFSPLTSTTCIGCCGARTLMSHKWSFLPCKWLHLYVAVGTFITIKLTMPWWWLVLVGCSHMYARN